MRVFLQTAFQRTKHFGFPRTGTRPVSHRERIGMRECEPDYLDRLTRLSPDNVQAVPLEVDGLRRKPWMTRPEKLVVSGLTLILVCSLLLFWTYGLASLTDIEPNDPHYWPEVLGKMFALKYGGTISIPASFGLVLGIALLLHGVFKSGQPPSFAHRLSDN